MSISTHNEKPLGFIYKLVSDGETTVVEYQNAHYYKKVNEQVETAYAKARKELQTSYQIICNRLKGIEGKKVTKLELKTWYEDKKKILQLHDNNFSEYDMLFDLDGKFKKQLNNIRKINQENAKNAKNAKIVLFKDKSFISVDLVNRVFKKIEDEKKELEKLDRLSKYT